MTALLFISMALPTAMGFLFVSWLMAGEERAGLFLRLSLGFGLGLGLLSYQIFIIGLLGIPFSRATTSVLPVVTILILLFLIYRSGSSFKDTLLGSASGGEAPGQAAASFFKRALIVILIAWIVVKCAFVFTDNLYRPVHSWDAWLVWSSAAKLFFYEKGLILDPANWNFFGTGYRTDLGYPLHTPLVQVWVALWIGEFHEVFVKLWSSLFFVSLIGLFYTFLRRETSFFYALVFTFFFAATPLLTYHGVTAYNDLPLAYYSLAAVICFWRYLKTDSNMSLVIAGIMLAVALFTKLEGLFFVTAFAFTMLASIVIKKKKFLKPIITVAVPFFIVIGPWLVFKFLNGYSFGHSTDGIIKDAYVDKVVAAAAAGAGGSPEVSFLSSIATVVKVFIAQAFLTSNYNLLFAFWAVITLFGLKELKGSDIKYLYIFIFAVIAQFIGIYATTEATHLLDGTAIFRNILTYMPIILFTTAMLLNRIRSRA